MSTYPAWAESQFTRDALDALPAQVDATTPAPVIDEAIRCMDNEAMRIGEQITKLVDYLHWAIGEKQVTGRVGDYLHWPTSTREAIDTARALPADTVNAHHFTRSYKGYETVGDVLADYDALQALSSKIAVARRPLTAQFNERRWERVYLVANDGGHVHRHTACRTCYVTTKFHWITELSDATDAEVIDAAGERTCLVCFPEVREEILAGRPCRIESREGREERKAREAEAAAKKAAKAVKAITNSDGSPLVILEDGSRRRTLQTEIAAQRAASEAMFNLGWYGPTHPEAEVWTAQINTILPALAHKRGTAVESERALLTEKAKAKVKRERGY